jgi:hypothetical protein
MFDRILGSLQEELQKNRETGAEHVTLRRL